MVTKIVTDISITVLELLEQKIKENPQFDIRYHKSKTDVLLDIRYESKVPTLPSEECRKCQKWIVGYRVWYEVPHYSNGIPIDDEIKKQDLFPLSTVFKTGLFEYKMTLRPPYDFLKSINSLATLIISSQGSSYLHSRSIVNQKPHLSLSYRLPELEERLKRL